MWVFQNLMVRSAVPPPEASRLDWKGHHASALTAAVCAVKRCRGAPPAAPHTCSRLSLPPLASCAPLGDHFRPHTSCSCPRSVAVMCSRTLHAQAHPEMSVQQIVAFETLGQTSPGGALCGKKSH